MYSLFYIFVPILLFCCFFIQELFGSANKNILFHIHLFKEENLALWQSGGSC